MNKKIINIVFIIFCFMVLMVGCEKKVYYWKIAYDLDRVTSIQIVDAASETNYEVIKRFYTTRLYRYQSRCVEFV